MSYPKWAFTFKKKKVGTKNRLQTNSSVYYLFYLLILCLRVYIVNKKVRKEKRKRREADTIAHSSNMWQQIIMGIMPIDQWSAGNWYQQSLFSPSCATISSLTHSSHHNVRNVPWHHVAHSTRWLLQSIKKKLNYSNDYASEILFICVRAVVAFLASYIHLWWIKNLL